MQRNSQPLDWLPEGTADTLDASEAPRGAMALLSNLIPDPTTKGLWQCRPASISLTSFGGFNTPGFVSCLLIVSNRAYGLIQSQRVPGCEEPFSFNLLTNTFDTISGTFTTATLPTNQPTTGDWTPPSVDVIGSKVVICSNGFNGTASAANNFFGYIDISTPTAPAWANSNFTYSTSSHFTTAPIAVQQFGGRAYYIHPLTSQPAVIFSDVNNPLANTVTTTVPVLTFGDSEALTALAGLPLNNQLGGVIQSLIVFKSVTNTYQVTGDSATSNLAINALNIATGTFSPLSVVPTPKGLAFIAPDGLRIIDFDARVSDPLGIDGQGVNIPFLLAVHPSRTVAACNGNILRISVQNGAVGGTPTQEYWFDFARKIFHGPHTFPASLMSPYSNTFVMTPAGINAKLFQSDQVQSLTSTFVENGQQLTWTFTTAFLPDPKTMVNYCMTESTLNIALAAGVPPVQIAAQNWSMNVIDSVSLVAPGNVPLWGSFNWGAAIWGGQSNALTNLQIQWHLPLVFDRLQIQITGQSAQAHRIGRLKGRYQQLRTWQNISAAA